MLGILACAGRLPIEIAAAAEASGRRVHIVAIDGFADAGVSAFAHERVRLGQIGRMLASFKRAGVGEITIAGAMQRPNLLRLRVDHGFFVNLPTVLSLTRGGDDSVLRRVVAFFERHGLAVVGVGDVAPGLLAGADVMSRRPAQANEVAAWQRAARLAHDLGRFDVGQAVVAQAGAIVAVEGVRGTDAMLRDLGPGGIGAGLGAGGVLLKLAKPGQDMRIDVPTIGPQTVALAAAAGLTAIGVGAGGTIMLERAAAVAAADSAGLALVGLADGFVREAVEGRSAERSDNGQMAAAAVPDFISRRTPTPADRRDLHIGRAVMEVAQAHGAGSAVIVSREHVLGIGGQMPVAAFIAAQRGAPSWGRRVFKSLIGVVVLQGAAGGGEGTARTGVGLDREVSQAAKAAGLAGIGYLGAVQGEELRRDVTTWANEAGIFLIAHGEAE